MKKLFAVMVLALLAGCGSFETRQVGLEEETLLVIRAQKLVGMRVELDSGFSKTITEEDLTEYTMGIGGATDPEVQNLEAITLKVTSGEQRVTVSNGGATVLDRRLHFTHGQTRELRIR